MSQRLLLAAVAWFMLLSCAAPMQADTVAASGAGALPGTAEDLTGMNVTEITGSIPDTTDPLLGVNMFKIDIMDYANFSAITIGSPFGMTDTELFLFDSTGLGVLGNDDISGSNTLSCLPSAVGGNPLCPSPLPAGVGPTADGTYYLAITRSANSPLSADGYIFTMTLSTDVVGPDTTMGGNSPITDWDGGAFPSSDTDLVNFDILLTGTSPATTPEPATWIFMAIGLIFIFAFWKQPRAKTPLA